MCVCMHAHACVYVYVCVYLHVCTTRVHACICVCECMCMCTYRCTCVCTHMCIYGIHMRVCVWWVLNSQTYIIYPRPFVSFFLLFFKRFYLFIYLSVEGWGGMNALSMQDMPTALRWGMDVAHSPGVFWGGGQGCHHPLTPSSLRTPHLLASSPQKLVSGSVLHSTGARAP